jgi:hypothetical protein
VEKYHVVLILLGVWALGLKVAFRLDKADKYVQDYWRVMESSGDSGVVSVAVRGER